MTRKKLVKLIDKYLEQKCSPEEERLLSSFLDSYQINNQIWDEEKHGNETVFKKRTLMNIKRSILENGKQYKITRRLHPIFRYAAVFIGILSVLGGLYFYTKGLPNENVEIQEITLELHDGTSSILRLESEQTITAKNGTTIAKQDNNVLILNENDSGINELVYNTIKIPYGKQFQLALSDGTHVFLNSGSTFRFPTKFTSGPRKVFLTGEAYFNVTKDKNRFFEVITDKLTSKVYGTQFNVSSYVDDEQTNIVLVEGSIGVTHEKNPEKETLLVPNEMALLNHQSNHFGIKKVNPQKYTAWTKGTLFFKNDTFKDITKKLERHYNVEIVNNYPSLNNEKFTGKFEKSTSLTYILNIFKNNFPFQFQINENRISINP